MKKSKLKILEEENQQLKDFVIGLNLIISRQKEFLENMKNEIERLRGDQGHKIIKCG